MLTHTVPLTWCFLGSGDISWGMNLIGPLICLLDLFVPSGSVSIAISASSLLAWSHSEHCLQRRKTAHLNKLNWISFTQAQGVNLYFERNSNPLKTLLHHIWTIKSVKSAAMEGCTPITEVSSYSTSFWFFFYLGEEAPTEYQSSDLETKMKTCFHFGTELEHFLLSWYVKKHSGSLWEHLGSLQQELKSTAEERDVRKHCAWHATTARSLMHD